MFHTNRRSVFTSRLLIHTTILVTCLLLFLNSYSWEIPHYPPTTPNNKSLPFISIPRKTIPRKLWYKLGPNGLSEESRIWTNTCISKNPKYRVEFLTDSSADTYVQENFAYRPDIVDMYLSLRIPILKADLLRYLILYAEGGIWSDLDVTCSDIPISGWISVKLEEETSLVVGLEFDSAWKSDGFLHSQFASWVIMAKPGGKHMLAIINDAFDRIHEKTQQHNVTISELGYDQVGLVVDLTGPKGMTRSLVRSLEESLATTLDDRNISGLVRPILMDDVVILPGNAFAASQTGFPQNQGPALISHQYAGTWKNDYDGEDIDE